MDVPQSVDLGVKERVREGDSRGVKRKLLRYLQPSLEHALFPSGFTRTLYIKLEPHVLLENAAGHRRHQPVHQLAHRLAVRLRQTLLVLVGYHDQRAISFSLLGEQAPSF